MHCLSTYLNQYSSGDWPPPISCPRNEEGLSFRNFFISYWILYTGYRQEDHFSMTISLFGDLFFKIWKYIHTTDPLVKLICKWQPHCICKGNFSQQNKVSIVTLPYSQAKSHWDAWSKNIRWTDWYISSTISNIDSSSANLWRTDWKRCQQSRSKIIVHFLYKNRHDRMYLVFFNPLLVCFPR